MDIRDIIDIYFHPLPPAAGDIAVTKEEYFQLFYRLALRGYKYENSGTKQ